MAFTLEVIRGSTTYNISNGNPFSIDDGNMLGGASVRNIEESGPYQDGATHLSERLDPRTITLRINVQGASASALDGHRDTLMTIFKPVRGVPITLKLTRDDGGIRHIDTRRVGPLDIPLVKEHKPGNFHRAVVQLRAADPTYYNPTQGTANFAAAGDSWYTAGGSIPVMNVLAHAQFPAQGAAMGLSGSIAGPNPSYTIFFRSGSVAVGADHYAFRIASSDAFYTDATTYNVTLDGGGDFTVAGGTIMTSGTHNYYVIAAPTLNVYRDGALVAQDLSGASTDAFGISNAFWRASDGASNNPWPEVLPYAAVYNIALSSGQRAALNDVTTGGGAGTVANGTVVYTGDVDSYPVITIAGPLTSPIIVNTTTGDALDLTGAVLGSADIWTIDTRYGRKGITNQAGSSVMQYLSDDSNLATFRLVPAPLAAGGTNLFAVEGSSGGTATAIQMVYYTRYLSY